MKLYEHIREVWKRDADFPELITPIGEPLPQRAKISGAKKERPPRPKFNTKEAIEAAKEEFDIFIKTEQYRTVFSMKEEYDDIKELRRWKKDISDKEFIEYISMAEEGFDMAVELEVKRIMSKNKSKEQKDKNLQATRLEETAEKRAREIIQQEQKAIIERLAKEKATALIQESQQDIIEGLAAKKAEVIVSNQKANSEVLYKEATQLIQEKEKDIIEDLAQKKAELIILKDYEKVISKAVKKKAKKKAKQLLESKEFIEEEVKKMAINHVEFKYKDLIEQAAKEKAEVMYNKLQDHLVSNSESVIEKEVQKRLQARMRDIGLG